MKLKKLAEVTMWLPGFAPDDPLPEARCTAEIIAFPLVSQVHDAVPVINEGNPGDIAERVVEVAADVPAPKPLRSVWPALDGSLHAMLRGEVGKFEANLAAIAVLSLLDAEMDKPDQEPWKLKFEASRSSINWTVPSAFEKTSLITNV